MGGGEGRTGDFSQKKNNQGKRQSQNKVLNFEEIKGRSPKWSKRPRTPSWN